MSNKPLRNKMKTSKLSSNILFQKWVFHWMIWAKTWGFWNRWFELVLRQQEVEFKSAVEREVILFSLRAERFPVGFGPIWLRRFCTWLFTRGSGAWSGAVIGFKILMSITFVCLPIGLFILLRGVFPVLTKVPNSEVPYASLGQPKFSVYDLNQANSTSLFTSEGKSVNRTIWKELPLPNGFQLHKSNHPSELKDTYFLGLGLYPRQVQQIHGKLISENVHMKVELSDPDDGLIRENIKKWKGNFALFPSTKSESILCKLVIKDALSQNIVWEGSQGKVLNHPVVPKWRQLFYERFVPAGLAGFASKLDGFVISGIKLPQTAILTVEPEYPANWVKKVTKKGSEEMDVSNDDCVYFIGNMKQEKVISSPQKRRGLIFVVVDSLNYQVSHDKKLMENVWRHFSKGGIDFKQHRSQGNMTVPSIVSTMYSRLPRELGPVAFSYGAPAEIKRSFYNRNWKPFPSLLAQKGINVGAIGNLSLLTEAMEGGIDVGFRDVTILEAPQYESRHITENALKWVADNSHTPFFLYLHYHTMHGPFRPELDLSLFYNLIKYPFGLKREQNFYRQLAKNFDQEFKTLIDGLEQMNLLDQIDLALTADHGAQLEPENFGIYQDLPNDLNAATRDKGYTLSDQEIRVPFLWKSARSASQEVTEVNGLTAHLDLYPTLLSWFGVNSDPELVSDRFPVVDLSSFLELQNKGNQVSLEEFVANPKRNWVYSEGSSHAGVIFPSLVNRFQYVKYVRQFSKRSAKLFWYKSPYAQRFGWYEPEQFSVVDIPTMQETIVPNLAALDLVRSRELFNQVFPSDRFLYMEAIKSQILNWRIKLKDNSPVELFKPDTVKVRQEGAEVWIDGKMEEGEFLKWNVNILQRIENISTKQDRFWGCAAGWLVESEVVFKGSVTLPCLEQPYLKSSLLETISRSQSTAQKGDVFSEWGVREAFPEGLTQSLQFDGAGQALREAIKDWGYER